MRVSWSTRPNAFDTSRKIEVAWILYIFLSKINNKVADVAVEIHMYHIKPLLRHHKLLFLFLLINGKVYNNEMAL